MKSLAIIVTHPIQYYVPVYQKLVTACRLKVFYTWGEKGANAKYDPDFQKNISWDIPLLDGYEFEFVENSAKDPGSHHYKGIVNPELIEKIKDFNPDAILVYGWAYQSHLAVMRHFKGKIQVWFRGDSNLLDEMSMLRKILRKLLLTWIYRHVDRAFYVGEANKAYYLDFGLTHQQLTFAPHAVDNTRFSAAKFPEAQHLRTSLGIKKDEILILFAGKFESKKNPLLLLQAFAEINNLANSQQKTNANDPKAHLLFVGNGVLEQSLKLETKNIPSLSLSKDRHDLSYQERIHFIDFQNQSQMPAVYQACNLFCLPSQGPGETWGLAVNEAMAAGKAVLVSDHVGCAKSLISNGKNGETFRSGDLTDLKNKLQALISNQERLVAMGLEGKEIIQKWTFEKQVEAFVKTLNEGR